MKLFWFSKVGTRDSFSRIAEEILPILKKDYGYQLYSIIPPLLQLPDPALFHNIIRMGDDIDEGGLKLSEEQFMGPMKRNLGSQMKYIVLQVLAHCQEESIEILFITMGVYEANWFMETIEDIRGTSSKNLLDNIKVVLYVPFDYIPSKKCIQWIEKADKVITTVPTNWEKGIGKDWGIVGHACSDDFKILPFPRNFLLKTINSMNGRFWNGKPIQSDEIIILNANLYGSRKRIEETVKAFNQVSKLSNLKLRLWLHGGATPEIEKMIDNPELLITSSKIKNSELNLIYNVCQIGLQTSWGEGWSLTNCEHAIIGKLQVVPNWLACGYHFSNGRGILIDVDQTDSINEAQYDVKIGVPNQESVEKCLLQAITTFEEYNPEGTIAYLKQYTWASAAEKLNTYLL